MAAITDAATNDLFVSFADVERDWVQKFLLGPLRAAGLSCYLEEAFKLGAPRVLEFERAIKQSRHTLLVLSPAYLADGASQLVDTLANHYGLLTASWPVIPLVLQRVSLPWHLAMLKGLDATRPEDWSGLCDRLVADLRPRPPGAGPGSAAADVDLGRSASNGLFALAALMHAPAVRDAVAAFGADFDAACEQVHVLTEHKQRHDLFQVLESAYWPAYHAARRSPLDEDAWGSLEFLASELLDAAEALFALGACGAAAVEEAWARKLGRARDELQSAVDLRAEPRLRDALAIFNSVLASEPSRTNARLVTAAGALRLSNLVEALTTVRDTLAGLTLGQGDERQVERFSTGVDELAALNVSLTGAVGYHDSFQAIDDELRRVEALLPTGVSQLEQAWRLDVQPLVSVLGGPNADWAAKQLAVLSTNLEDAFLLNDPSKATGLFRSYRSRTIRRFNEVDQALLDLCEELEKIGEPLVVMLRLIHD